MGLRERKKLRTRSALQDAAMRLFTEQGYEETTVAQIAAAADISTRTFFSYFASKEDVLFADSDARVDQAVTIVEQHEPDESPVDVLVRALGGATGSTETDVDRIFGTARDANQLLVSVPSLHARLLQRSAARQRRLAEAIRLAYPDQLDDFTAAVLVGAMVGAVMAAWTVGMDRGDSPKRMIANARRAMDLAAGGLRRMAEPVD